MLNRLVVGLQDAVGRRTGLGFLVTADRAFTCTHVLERALGSFPAEGSRVVLDRPLLGLENVQAKVIFAHAADNDEFGDIALLRLGAEVPGFAQTRMLRPSEQDERENLVTMFGFPPARDEGVWHYGRMRGRQAAGLIQVEPETALTYRIQRGFSGTAAWDEQRGGVVGMLVKTDLGETSAGYLIPADVLMASAESELRWEAFSLVRDRYPEPPKPLTVPNPPVIDEVPVTKHENVDVSLIADPTLKQPNAKAPRRARRMIALGLTLIAALAVVWLGVSLAEFVERLFPPPDNTSNSPTRDLFRPYHSRLAVGRLNDRPIAVSGDTQNTIQCGIWPPEKRLALRSAFHLGLAVCCTSPWWQWAKLVTARS